MKGAALVVAMALSGTVTAADIAQGAALFKGETPLAARLRHHERLLPAVATRCVNCHSGADAPRLSGAMLASSQPRFGGPAVAYDETSFCRVLRTGITPNHILLPQAMPQYQLTDAQCTALWAYLGTVPSR